MNYGHLKRKQPSLHGRKFTPTPKFLGTAKAYFVCHIGPIFQISLIYAFIGCPQSVIQPIFLPPLQFLHARWTLIVMAMVIVKTNLIENWRELQANACAQTNTNMHQTALNMHVSRSLLSRNKQENCKKQFYFICMIFLYFAPGVK